MLPKEGREAVAPGDLDPAAGAALARKGKTPPATVRSVLARSGCGARLAPREKALLLAAVLGVTRHRLYLMPERVLSQAERLRFARLVSRRRHGEPLAYLTGRVNFWTVTLEVTDGVLIPRPETECLVEAAVFSVAAMRAEMIQGMRPTRPVIVADIGTGSGAIALSLATEFLGTAEIHATDRSGRALAVAGRNVQSLDLAGHVTLHGPGDLLGPLVRDGICVDGLVMNPPYIRTRDMLRLSREVAREPRLALEGGPDGLSIVRRLVGAIRSSNVLRPGGFLWLEVGAGQAAQVRHLLEAAGFGEVQSRPDLAGIERVVGARWPASKSGT